MEQENKVETYNVTAVAFDCGGLNSDPITVSVVVTKACQPSWSSKLSCLHSPKDCVSILI